METFNGCWVLEPSVQSFRAVTSDQEISGLGMFYPELKGMDEAAPGEWEKQDTLQG